jgi:hypothetical protein
MRLARFAALCALGLVADIALAQLPTDMKLEDAGFVMRRADTTEKLGHAKRVPPRKFVARVKNGQRYYIYADPETCQCVFVGDEKAMQAFRDMRRRLAQPGIVPPSGEAPEAEMIEAIDSDVSDGSILDWKF